MTWRAGGDGRSIQIPADIWERVFGPKVREVQIIGGFKAGKSHAMREAALREGICLGCDLHTGPQPLSIHPE